MIARKTLGDIEKSLHGQDTGDGKKGGGGAEEGALGEDGRRKDPPRQRQGQPVEEDAAPCSFCQPSQPKNGRKGQDQTPDHGGDGG